MPYLRREGPVFIVHLGDPGERDTENRFHPDWIAAMNAILDQVTAAEGAAAVVTVGEGKFYSTGADLAWAADHPDDIDSYLTETQRLLARILTLPVPTVAALNGHTYGAGAFLAVAHDHRIMRTDRGYFCFPGVTLGANYAAASVEMIRSRLSAQLAHHVLVTGQRYSGPDALAAGLVDAIADEHQLLPTAIEHAHSLAPTAGPVLAHIKTCLHHTAAQALTDPVTGYNHHALAHRS